MATFNFNIKNRNLTAVFDNYIVSNNSTETLNVLDNDILGITPANITSIDTTGFSLGDLTINLDNQSIEFTSNGNLGTNNFSYIITDNISRTSIGLVTISVIT